MRSRSTWNIQASHSSPRTGAPRVPLAQARCPAWRPMRGMPGGRTKRVAQGRGWFHVERFWGVGRQSELSPSTRRHAPEGDGERPARESAQVWRWRAEG